MENGDSRIQEYVYCFKVLPIQFCTKGVTVFIDITASRRVANDIFVAKSLIKEQREGPSEYASRLRTMNPAIRNLYESSSSIFVSSGSRGNEFG